MKVQTLQSFKQLGIATIPRGKSLKSPAALTIVKSDRYLWVKGAHFMDKQEFSNQIKVFTEQNPEIIEAINVLNINVDQYLRTLASLTPHSSTSSSSTYPS